MKFGSVLGAQWRFVSRHWLPQTYALLLLAFCLVLRLVPAGSRPPVLAALALADPMLLGFFFMGALTLFEKKQGTARALMVLPGATMSVLAARVLLFSGFAVLAASVMGAAAAVPAPRVAALLPPLVLGSTAVTILGSALALKTPSMNSYLGLSGFSMAPAFAGLAPLLGISHPALAISPLWGPQEAFRAALGVTGGPLAAFSPHALTTGMAPYLYGIGHSAAWIVAALFLFGLSVRDQARKEA